jgi:hypothetical protein
MSNLPKSDNYLHQNLCISQNTELINAHKFGLIYILDSEYLKKIYGKPIFIYTFLLLLPSKHNLLQVNHNLITFKATCFGRPAAIIRPIET